MTAQVQEKLILEGQELGMAFCPPLPKDSSQIVAVKSRSVRKAIEEGSLPQYIMSTACWRGYIGIWEIRSGRLYLNDVVGRYKKASPEALFANWFSGVLRVPKGKILRAVNIGFASVHERELHIKIDRGVVVAEQEIDNSSKHLDRNELASRSLPGSENRFEGDDF